MKYLNIKITFLLFFAFSVSSILGQNKYAQDYFRNPLDVPISLAATFGELRSNHFHSGLDIRTQQRNGLKVHASADGYVARIKVSPWGYGNVLYINHPNGYTTVYAHLSKFNDEIAAYIEKQQYHRKEWSVELFPADSALRFKKGDIVAYSGSSGSAAGPHVHFEIRDTKTEKPVNPLLFGFKVPDKIPPIIQAINVYALGDSSSVNGEKLENRAVTGRSGQYRLSSSKTIQVKGEIGFAIKGYDKFSNNYHHVGYYSVQLLVDNKEVFKLKLNTFKFKNSRAINSLIDYPMYLKYQSRYAKSFIEPGDPLDIFITDNRKKSGRVVINDNNLHTITYKVSDYAGNVSQIIFTVKGNQNLSLPVEKPTMKKEGYTYRRFHYADSNTFMENGLLVNIPKGALFTDIDFYCKTGDTISGYFAPVYKVGSYEIPLLKPITIGIKPKGIPDSLKDKASIVKVWGTNSSWGEASEWNGEYLETKVKYFGKYSVKIDTTAPRISPVNIYNGKNMSRNSGISLKVSDNLTSVMQYDMYVDNKWVLTQYLRHTKAIYYRFNKHVPKGKHHLRAVVKDRVGNMAVYEADFSR